MSDETITEPDTITEPRAELRDWTDATQPGRFVVSQALARLRESLGPPVRRTEPTLVVPWTPLEESTELR